MTRYANIVQFEDAAGVQRDSLVPAVVVIFSVVALVAAIVWGAI